MGFIPHTGILLYPITWRLSVPLPEISTFQSCTMLQSNWFHLNFSCRSSKHGDIDETNNVSELQSSSVKSSYCYLSTSEWTCENRGYLTLHISSEEFQRYPLFRREKHGKKTHSFSPPSAFLLSWKWVTLSAWWN